MKSKLAAVLLASATLGAGPAIFAPPASALAQAEVSFEFFRDSLSPYGEWIEVGDYGLCWRPTDVSADWAPYTDGYWSYTDAGWTWVSYEDFGAVAYHYGRWVVVEDEGWVWVPDYEWGPAWVSWRNNDDYVGWAPLPPEAAWEPDRGFSVWVDSTYDIGPSYYNFCAVEDFGAPVIREVIIERPRNFFLVGDTFNITNISINRSIGVPFCGGPRFDFIRGRSRRPVPTLKLVRETNITNIEKNVYINKTVNKTVIRNGGGGRGLRAAVEGNQLIVPAPKVRRIDKAQAVAEVKPQRRVAANRVNRGWKGVKDENQRRELKEKLAKQTEGRRPDNARAKPVEVADLKPVPEKADPNAPSPVAGRGRNRDRDRDQDKKREGKAGEVAETQKPDRPDRDRPAAQDREERPGNGKRAENNKRDKAEEPTGTAGRGPLKPFNGADREDRKEQRKRDDAAPSDVPAPRVTEAPDADREGKRKQAAGEEKDREERQAKAKRASEDAQRQAADRQRQKMYTEEAERLKKRERNDNAPRQENNNRQREAAAMQQQQEAAAARRQEAAQQELRQQRRQQQMQQAESQQRRQERAVQDDRQQRMQQPQRQQAPRQQEQRAVQQQRQGQAERQMQMQRQAERQQQQRMQQQQQQRQQFQQQQRAPQQQQQQQQFRRQGGGGGGGEARGGGGGGRNRGAGEEAGERRDR